MVNSLNYLRQQFLEEELGIEIPPRDIETAENKWLAKLTGLDFDLPKPDLLRALFQTENASRWDDYLRSLGFSGSRETMLRDFYSKVLAISLPLTSDLNPLIPSAKTDISTFTRGTQGSYIDSDGLIQIAEIDEARFESSGILIEKQKTNLFLNSSAPATQTITVLNATEYVLSVKGSGSITLTGGGSGTATEGNDVIFTTTSTSITCTVSGSLDYAQVEKGSFATSIIITGGTPVIRNKDALNYDVSGIITQGQGSLYAEFEQLGIDNNEFPNIVNISDGTTDNRVVIETRHTTEVIRVQVINGSVSQANISTSEGGATFNTLHKVLVTYENNSIKFYVDGVLIDSDSSATIPTNLSIMNIGLDPNLSNQLNGNIKNVKYYERVLSESEAKRITTL